MCGNNIGISIYVKNIWIICVLFLSVSEKVRISWIQPYLKIQKMKMDY